MDKMTRQLIPFATLALIVGILAALEPDTFLTFENFFNVLRRSSMNGIIAVGMTVVIVSAGIDLSVGSMMALAGMVGAWSMIAIGGEDPSGAALWCGTGVGLGVGAACGLVNGLLITGLKLPPFIVTLGSMSVFRGLCYVMNSSNPYHVAEYTYLYEGTVLEFNLNVPGFEAPWVFPGIPIAAVIWAAVLLAAGFLMKYGRLGRHTYAIGSNREAAFHAGIGVNRTLIWIYSLTGLVAGLAAMITTSETVSAQPTAGITLELDIIAAVVIGGASLSGGRGTITGTIIGTLLISFLRNGCNMLGVDTNAQFIVIGIIIIAAVSIDQLARSKAGTG